MWVKPCGLEVPSSSKQIFEREMQKRSPLQLQQSVNDWEELNGSRGSLLG
jgi:hypothetical protein